MIKRTITVGELVSACIIIVGAILVFWINTNVRLTALEVQNKQQDELFIELKGAFEKVNNKLDRLSDGQNEIKITLQNKQDKK